MLVLLAIMPAQFMPNHTHIQSRSRHVIIRPPSLAKACGLGLTLDCTKLEQQRGGGTKLLLIVLYHKRY